MIEHILYSLFLVTFGMQIGRILTLRQQAKRTVEGITALLDSKWLGPQILAARIDRDQDAIGDLPAKTLVVWSPSQRMPVWLEMQYEFRRWRVPRLRRVG
jgi:hypothetical protein